MLQQHQLATLMLITEERSRWSARECARGAAAAALTAIASVMANAALGIVVAFVLVAGLLSRRVAWLGQARAQHADALVVEMAASFAASDWERRTRWGLRRSA